MTRAAAKTESGAEKERGSGVIEAGQGAGRKLLAREARELLAEAHSRAGRSMTLEEKSELRGKLSQILGDSDAPSLKSEETDAIPLRCKGDPFDMGSYASLHEALIDLRDYLNSNHSIMSTDIRSETGHDMWGGYGSM